MHSAATLMQNERCVNSGVSHKESMLSCESCEMFWDICAHFVPSRTILYQMAEDVASIVCIYSGIFVCVAFVFTILYVAWIAVLAYRHVNIGLLLNPID